MKNASTAARSNHSCRAAACRPEDKSTPMPNCGGYDAEHFGTKMCKKKFPQIFLLNLKTFQTRSPLREIEDTAAGGLALRMDRRTDGAPGSGLIQAGGHGGA